MKNKLKNMRFYLAGPIDCAKDKGVGWRKEIKTFLHTYNSIVIDPTDKPKGGPDETPNMVEYIHWLKKEGEFEKVREIMKPIVNYDLSYVDRTDATILHVDKESFMCGSWHEFAMAELEKKPILVQCKQGLAELPNWVYGLLPQEFLFESWEDMKNYLVRLDEGGTVSHRWKFMEL